jgi:hypothetical protein
MSAPSHPYRASDASAAPTEREPVDVLATGGRIAPWLLLGWALIRIALCTVHALDFQGFVALVIVAFAMAR